MCSSKSSGTSCLVVPRAMSAFSPVPVTARGGARRAGEWFVLQPMVDNELELVMSVSSTSQLNTRGASHEPPWSSRPSPRSTASSPVPDDLPGPIFDWYEAGDVERHVQGPRRTRSTSRPASADYLDFVRRPVPADRPPPVRLRRRLGRPADRGRPRVRGDPSRGAGGVAGALPRRAVHVLHRRCRGRRASRHRARRRRHRRRVRRRRRRTGGRGGAGRRAGDRASRRCSWARARSSSAPSPTSWSSTTRPRSSRASACCT